MATTPPQPLPLPVLSLRQAAAILLGWLLVNLVLLAPLLRPLWDGAEQATRQMQVLGDRLVGILCVLGLAALVAAWFMKDRAARWFGVLAVSVQGGAWLLSLPQEPSVTVLFALHALVQLPLFFFALSFSPGPDRSIIWIVPLAVAAEVLVALCMPAPWRTGWLVAVGGLWLLLGLWMAGAMARAAGGRHLARRLLALSVCLTACAVAAQLLSWSGVAAAASAALAAWVPAAGLVLAVSYMLVLVLQLIGAESQARAAQTELAGRLVSERAGLEAAFAQRQQRQLGEAQARERSRIMRELHDGLGSPLVAALALLSTAHPVNKAAADLIDLCLQELRGTIDALGTDFHDVGELLGAFRDRMEPVLEAQGIVLDWQVQPLPATARLPAGERLHVMRIVQEAFTNILKHSGASQVILRAETQASGCSVIDIIDNGGGLRPGAVLAPGWGLSNMHERAALLGAQLSCTDGETCGVHVRLALHCAPLQAPPDPAQAFPRGIQRPRHA